MFWHGYNIRSLTLIYYDYNMPIMKSSGIKNEKGTLRASSLVLEYKDKTSNKIFCYPNLFSPTSTKISKHQISIPSLVFRRQNHHPMPPDFVSSLFIWHTIIGFWHRAFVSQQILRGPFFLNIWETVSRFKPVFLQCDFTKRPQRHLFTCTTQFSDSFTDLRMSEHNDLPPFRWEKGRRKYLLMWQEEAKF